MDEPDDTLEEQLLAEIQANDLVAPYEHGEPVVLILLEAVANAPEESS